MSAPATLDDDVVTEILLRLPCTSVLRSRAVCKAWHRITTDSSFLAAHAGRRPAELLVVSGEPAGAYRDRLDTIPLSLRADEGPTGHRRELHYPEHCEVHFLVGCCHGLLLFLLDRFPPGHECCSYFFVCNPATRQGTWLDLMPLPPARRGNLLALCGFYRHGPSGEHRFLVLANERQSPEFPTNIDFVTGSAAHYVFNFSAATVSSEAPRRLGPVPGNIVLKPYCSQNQPPRHLYHRGNLHWTTHPQATSAGKILAFDTLSEEFRLISCPAWPRGQHYRDDLCLLELHGMLAITTTLLCGGFMELWVLEDYDDDDDDRSWSHRFRIQMPPPFCVRWTMSTGIPDIILVGSYPEKLAAVYHLTEEWSIEKIGFINSNTSARHFLFKESLVTHDFFDPY